MYIMHGDPGTLIEAATLAVDECKGSGRQQANSCLVSDCYSRALLLGNDFNKELSAVAEKVSLKTGGIILEGVLALGEIGDGERPLEFITRLINQHILWIRRRKIQRVISCSSTSCHYQSGAQWMWLKAARIS